MTLRPSVHSSAVDTGRPSSAAAELRLQIYLAEIHLAALDWNIQQRRFGLVASELATLQRRSVSRLGRPGITSRRVTVAAAAIGASAPHLEGWDMLYNIHFMLRTTFAT